jgi:hypothetical protein
MFLTDSVLASNIAPNIERLYGRNIASVLALPLIYAATHTISVNNTSCFLLPEKVRHRVLRELNRLSGNRMTEADLCKIVQKKPLVVNGHGG